MDKEHLDLLKKIEELTANLNKLFSKNGKPVFSRYPLTFALLIIFGATMVAQGVKDLILKIPFFNDRPLPMILIGIIVLIVTGSLYRKLDK